MNPVDDTTFTKPLVKALRKHVDAFAEDLAGTKATLPQVEAARPCAVAWVYYSVLVAWAQDHGLVDPWLRAEGQELRRGVPVTACGWLAMSYASLAVHPATQCLLDPRYSALQDGHPSDRVCEDLMGWWATAPSLAYEVTSGPESISGWLPGDLLQALSDARRKGFALAQTPWWIADFILDKTLIPAAEEFRAEKVLRNIDPTCGTGHFLIRMVDYLWELYTTGSLHPRQIKSSESVTGWTPTTPRDAIARILAGVDGCEKDPLTAAVARLCMVVAIGDLMHRSGLLTGSLRLDTIPPMRPRIVVGDSLLLGVMTPEEYAEAQPLLADIYNPPLPKSTVVVDEPVDPNGQFRLFGDAA